MRSPVLHYAFNSWIEKTMTKNNTLPLGKHICFTIVWGCVEILPNVVLWQTKSFITGKFSIINWVDNVN